MNKKIVSVLVLALLMGTASLSAIGIGAQAGYVAGPNHSNGALTFKLDTAPWVFALNIDGLSTEYLGIGITADGWLANKMISAPVAYYYGWGIAASAYSANNSFDFLFLGARALLGINSYIVDDFLELYAQIAWQPGVNIFTGDSNTTELVISSFPVNVGFRLWF